MTSGTRTPRSTQPAEHIVDIDVGLEMQNAFLEYSVSVIHSRALPDVRDGLKPVQRRILYSMHEMGLRPERGHVKSSRVVGDVMGKFHPHGDAPIYDALVRMAQAFTMRLPLIDGHGNFGSLDDGPAASRYTEVRLDPAAQAMTAGLDENTIKFVPNYDEQLQQQEVLPAAYPNLLVNGVSGIAVGFATNMPPHNLIEVIAAARHLLEHPHATLDELMRFVPGPDLPGGGTIVGLAGIRDAYLTGKGSFRARATARIEKVSPRKSGIVVTELPYLVGPEKVIERIKTLVQSKKLQGISDVKDLTDRKNGLRLIIEIKNGFNPDAVLETLYKLTPMEDSFGINSVALVDGQPRTLGLKELLQHYLDFRTEVIRRRTQFRADKASDQLHLVEGLLVAILDIDEVIQLIRSSDDTATARRRLIDVFDLTQAQADHILELQLRRLTKFSRIELEQRRDELTTEITKLRDILDSDEVLRKTVGRELNEVAKRYGTPRRTVLLESSGVRADRDTPLEVGNDPCWVLMSSTGLLARTATEASPSGAGPRAKHDAIVARVRTTARADIGLLTSKGRVIRMSALELPTLAESANAPSLSGGAPLAAYVELDKNEAPITIVSLDLDAPGLAIGTARGAVKRTVLDAPQAREWTVISLKDGDSVVGAGQVTSENNDLVFVSSDAQLLRFPASAVRPQGRGAAGMAGIRVASGAQVAFFGVVDPTRDNLVITSSGSSDALPGTQPGSLKSTPLTEFPAKGRATGGVRAHRFVKGEDTLVLAWVGAAPARASGPGGVAIELPTESAKRDGSGVAGSSVITGIGAAPN